MSDILLIVNIESRRTRFQLTRAELQKRFGARVLVPARAAGPRPSAIPSGFAALDELIGGIPGGALTLLSGRGASGKLTLAYRVLAHAQQQGTETVGILDLTSSADPDDLARCGVALAQLLCARLQPGQPPVQFLLDWVQTRRLRAVLVDHLPGLAGTPERARHLRDSLPQLCQALAQTGCALLVIDEPQPAWQSFVPYALLPLLRQHAALHIEFQHERWLERAHELYGYAARLEVKKNKGARSGQSVSILIEFAAEGSAGLV